ncbi:MAG: hypothetical protein ACP5F8_03090, partial [Candidatus Aenigmatarchaeota archaeon]
MKDYMRIRYGEKVPQYVRERYLKSIKDSIEEYRRQHHEKVKRLVNQFLYESEKYHNRELL